MIWKFRNICKRKAGHGSLPVMPASGARGRRTALSSRPAGTAERNPVKNNNKNTLKFYRKNNLASYSSQVLNSSSLSIQTHKGFYPDNTFGSYLLVPILRLEVRNTLYKSYHHPVKCCILSIKCLQSRMEEFPSSHRKARPACTANRHKASQVLQSHLNAWSVSG